MTVTPGGGISAEDLQSVVDAQTDMMPELVDVFPRVTERDGRGGTRDTWPTPDPPIQTIGRVGKTQDRDLAMFAGQLRGKSSSVLTAPLDAPVAERDRIHVIGTLYQIVGEFRASYATARRFMIEEV